MIAPVHAPQSPRPLRFAIGTALVLGCLFARALSHGASEDPTPDRPATNEEIQALRDKIDSLAAFRAVYELESKVSTGLLTLNFRDPDEGHLSVHFDAKKEDKAMETEVWVLDGQLTLRIHDSEEKKIYATATYREPFEFTDRVRAALVERFGGLKGADVPSVEPAFLLNFAKRPDDIERINVNGRLDWKIDRDMTRVRWFTSTKDWDAARRIGDWIEVENDGCRYRFAIDSGFLTEATIADRGSVKLRELHMEVEAKEFVPARPAPDSKDDSAQLQRTAWRDGLEYAREIAFTCLAEQDEAEKLDDDHLEAWKGLLLEQYERWFSAAFEREVTGQGADLEAFLDKYSKAFEAAQGDAAALEAVEKAKEKWRAGFEAAVLNFVDHFAKSLTVPSKTKIASSTGDRGLDTEREAVRAAGRKAMLDPLLQRLDEGVAAAGERK